MTDHQTLDPPTRRAGRFAAGVLAADAAAHVYWLTGATWPFPDDRALSMAVLGYPAPFTARVLIPLVLLLATAASALRWRLRRGPHGVAGRAAHLVTLAVAGAAALQVPLRVAWALGLGGRGAGPAFQWLNVAVYLPMCALLALAAHRVAGCGLARGRWQRGLARGRWPRGLALAVPMGLAAALAVAAYGYRPGTGGLPAVDDARSRFVDTAVARFHYLRGGSGAPLVLLPGGTASTFAREPQLEALSAGHTVYAVDLPGQGYTAAKQPDFAYDLPSMEAGIGAFLDGVGLARVDRHAITLDCPDEVTALMKEFLT